MSARKGLPREGWRRRSFPRAVPASFCRHASRTRTALLNPRLRRETVTVFFGVLVEEAYGCPLAAERLHPNLAAVFGPGFLGRALEILIEGNHLAVAQDAAREVIEVFEIARDDEGADIMAQNDIWKYCSSGVSRVGLNDVLIWFGVPRLPICNMSGSFQ